MVGMHTRRGDAESMKGSYFSSTAHAVRQEQLAFAPAPPVRTAHDVAYAAALSAGHSPEVAAAAAAIAARAVIAVNPLNVSLVLLRLQHILLW